jgi:hypothetical protein
LTPAAFSGTKASGILRNISLTSSATAIINNSLADEHQNFETFLSIANPTPTVNEKALGTVDEVL